MRILIEGPDGSGKSVLARTLKNCFNAEYFHNTYEADDSIFLAQNTHLLHYLETTHDNVIIDRWLPSEYVYGNIFRGKSRVSTVEEITNRLHLFDYVIFCLPYDYNKYIDSFKKCCDNRDEYITKIDTMTKIYYSYQGLYLQLRDIFSNSQTQIIRYDYFTNIHHGS